MAIRFIRQPSETPNINNSDDTRMIRYAYGGYDGFVKNKGEELNHSVEGTTFRIKSGVIVLQGYESELDANGWSMTFVNSPTPHYYSVYYEVNLATQDAEIKSSVSTGDYPSVDAGENLTTNSTGTARLLLYEFRVAAGVVVATNKKVKGISYTHELISDMATKADVADKKEIDGHEIRARKLIGSGMGHKSQLYLDIQLSETLGVDEVLEVEVQIYLEPSWGQTFTGTIRAGTTELQGVGTIQVPEGPAIAFWGMEIKMMSDIMRCYPVSQKLLELPGTWGEETYGRYVRIYRYLPISPPTPGDPY